MIEGQARAEAKARQVAGQNAGRDIQHGKLVGGQTATIQKQPSISHKARDEIAEAVGMVAMLGQARANSWWPNGHNLSTAQLGGSEGASGGGAVGAMITNGAGCGQLATPRKQAAFKMRHQARPCAGVFPLKGDCETPHPFDTQARPLMPDFLS